MMNPLLNASIGAPITRAGISLTPVYLHQQCPELLDAHGAGVTITERPDAEVPTLTLHNPSDRPVLVPGGMVVEGGHQNRVVNVPVIVEAHGTLNVSVSCVQAGRWGGGSEFRLGRAFAPRRVRDTNARTTARSVQRGEKRADQHEIWDSVRAELHQLGVDSTTANLEERYIAAEADRERAGAIEELIGLGPLVGQHGIVVSHGRRIIAADLFGSPELLQANWQALITSHFSEHVVHGGGRPSLSQALRFLRRFATARAQMTPGTGLGTERHVDIRRLSGQALLLDDAVVYASCFALAA